MLTEFKLEPVLITGLGHGLERRLMASALASKTTGHGHGHAASNPSLENHITFLIQIKFWEMLWSEKKHRKQQTNTQVKNRIKQGNMNCNSD